LTTFIKNDVPFHLGALRRKKLVDLAVFYALGIGLVFAGIIIIIAAIIVASARAAGKGKVKGEGVIIIGPIPIIFGTDKKSVKTVLVMALALVIALIVAMLVYYWLLR